MSLFLLILKNKKIWIGVCPFFLLILKDKIILSDPPSKYSTVPYPSLIHGKILPTYFIFILVGVDNDLISDLFWLICLGLRALKFPPVYPSDTYEPSTYLVINALPGPKDISKLAQNLSIHATI